MHFSLSAGRLLPLDGRCEATAAASTSADTKETSPSFRNDRKHKSTTLSRRETLRIHVLPHAGPGDVHYHTKTVHPLSSKGGRCRDAVRLRLHVERRRAAGSPGLFLLLRAALAVAASAPGGRLALPGDVPPPTRAARRQVQAREAQPQGLAAPAVAHATTQVHPVRRGCGQRWLGGRDSEYVHGKLGEPLDAQLPNSAWFTALAQQPLHRWRQRSWRPRRPQRRRQWRRQRQQLWVAASLKRQPL